MLGFDVFVTNLVIFNFSNGGYGNRAKNPHVSNAETVGSNFKNMIGYDI